MNSPTLDRPLRLLVAADLPCDPSSGSAGTVYYTSQALRALGHHVDEIWGSDLGRRRITHGNLHALIEQPLTLRREVLKRMPGGNYDVVQISHPPAWLAARAIRRSGDRAIVVNRSHGVELRVDAVLDPWYTRLGVARSRSAWVTRQLASMLAWQWTGIRSHCDGMIVGCELDRQYLCEKVDFDPARVAAIAHGVEPQYLLDDLADRSSVSGQRILHVGQDAFYKGATLLPPIVSRVLAAAPEATFTWVCPSAHHKSILQSFDAAIRPRVHLRDWMPIAQLRAVYDQHDIFLFPSLFEGFGKAPLEAMARGLCVVTSDEGGMRDCIRDGMDGWICPPGDVEAFAQRTLHMCQSRGEMQAMGVRARARAVIYSWKRCASLAVEFYRGLDVSRRGLSASVRGKQQQ